MFSITLFCIRIVVSIFSTVHFFIPYLHLHLISVTLFIYIDIIVFIITIQKLFINSSSCKSMTLFFKKKSLP